MPRIDDIKIQEKVFKKKEYRSWDGNLLEKLKLTDDRDGSNQISSTSHNRKVDTLNSEKSGFDQGSTKVQLKSSGGSDRALPRFSKGSIEAQPESNKGSIKAQLNLKNRVQPEFVSDRENVQQLISKLGGNEKKLFFYVIDICSIKGSLSTGEIIGKTLTNAISTTRNGRETAIKRLLKKGLLKRERGKTGANGTLCLYVSELIKTEALNYLEIQSSEQALLFNRVQQLQNNRVQLGSVKDVHNSSNYINNITTKDLQLSEEWTNINMEPLHDIGFSMTQLKQLIDKNTPEIVQESINHFAYGLEHNPKTQKYDNPLNVLMGVLRKGQGWFEQNYESPQERAMRVYTEQKKARQERERAVEEEFFQIHYQEWFDGQDKTKLIKMLPEAVAKLQLEGPKIAFWRQYYRDEYWPEKRKQVFETMGLLHN